MQLTIDSTDNRDAAIAAVGALFGVRLGILPADADVIPAATPARRRGSGRTAGVKRTHRAASTTKRSPAGRATSSPAGGGQKPAKRSSSASDRRPRRTATATSTSDLNARIRAWAQGQGLTVASRGRIPASIADAYRAANSS